MAIEQVRKLLPCVWRVLLLCDAGITTVSQGLFSLCPFVPLGQGLQSVAPLRPLKFWTELPVTAWPIQVKRSCTPPTPSSLPSGSRACRSWWGRARRWRQRQSSGERSVVAVDGGREREELRPVTLQSQPISLRFHPSVPLRVTPQRGLSVMQKFQPEGVCGP